MMNRRKQTIICFIAIACFWPMHDCLAQSVCLPAPRLLTTLPMGGAAGSEFEITITGDHLEDAGRMYFSNPGITANQKLDADNNPLPNQYIVTIASDCPRGIQEARVMTQIGVNNPITLSVEMPK